LSYQKATKTSRMPYEIHSISGVGRYATSILLGLFKKNLEKDQKYVSAILKESLNDHQRLQECILELVSREFSSAADTIERFQDDVMN